MFLDRYFVTLDFEAANESNGILPRVGVFDKWDPVNGAWTPDQNGGNDNVPTNGGNDGPAVPVKPVVPVAPEEDESSGMGAFWAIFLILLFLGIGALLIKFFGKQCLEKIQEMRGGGGGFKTG